MTIKDPTAPARRARHVEAQTAAGLVRVRVWVPAAKAQSVRDHAAALCAARDPAPAERLRAGGSDSPATTGKRDSS